MRFQTKIFLWMLGALVAILIPTLLIVESRLISEAERRMALQFENQVGRVLDERRTRLETVSQTATELAGDEVVRQSLTGTLDEADMRGFAQLVLEKHTVARARGAKPNRPSSSQRPNPNPIRPGAANQISKLLPVLCTVDLDGEIKELSPRKPGKQSPRRTMDFRHDGTVRKLPDIGEIQEQQVGYVISTHPERGDTLREVVATPVRDGGGDLLGVFLMGINAETQLDHFISKANRDADQEGSSTGFFAEDQVVQVRGLKGIDRVELGELVAAEILADQEKGMSEVSLDGRPFQFTWQELNPGSLLPGAYQIAFFPLSTVQADIRALQLKLLLVGVGAVAVAVLASLLIARGLAEPVKRLERAAREIGRGDFDTRVSVSSRDELGRLGTAFNQMAEGLALKERYREVLSKVSDETVAQSLIEGELELGGETRHLTVLFCDIRGFTSLTESMDPQRVIDLLNAHMTAMTQVVRDHQGVIDKFVGDEIMAVFGAPKEYGDDEANALRCALAMVAKRQELNAEAEPPFEIGVGLATGDMVAGCMGSVDRLNYTVVGESVNLASRLCGKAAPGEVLAAVEPSLVTDGDLIEIEVKGFSGNVQALRVRAARRKTVENPATSV